MSIPLGLLLAITILLTLCVVAVVACVVVTVRNGSHFHLIAEKASDALKQGAHNRRQIDELQRRATDIECRLSNFHKGLNSTNERMAELFEPKPDPHTDTLNHFEHRLNGLHNELSALCNDLGVQWPEVPKAPEAPEARPLSP